MREYITGLVNLRFRHLRGNSSENEALCASVYCHGALYVHNVLSLLPVVTKILLAAVFVVVVAVVVIVVVVVVVVVVV